MSADKNDASVGWTVQNGQPPREEEALVGAAFHTSQLPIPERQAELGANYKELWDNVGGNLVVFEDKAEASAHPRGPSPQQLDVLDVYHHEVVEGYEKGVAERKEADLKAREQDTTAPVDKGDAEPQVVGKSVDAS